MIPFSKYQGAGNDFVMVDQRKASYLDKSDRTTIARLCDRRFGVGADGLILLQNHPDYDFEMVYFNADGREGSLCGNGGRCTVAFARHLGLIGAKCQFLAVDGPHEALVNGSGDWVELKMHDLSEVKKGSDFYEMDTGSPHYVQLVEGLPELDVLRRGREVRNSAPYEQAGINVNFIEPTAEGFAIRTYERGVENETLACGTGVTAAAIAYALQFPERADRLLTKGGIPAGAQGGSLKVRFERDRTAFRNIWLCGPATFVFSGEVEANQRGNF